jgi:catechol 2,3-dioxygenase-like lactoylglutathione lyase family enzyme
MNIDLQRGCSVAIAVRSIDAVVETYTEVLGLGPFETREIELTDAAFRERNARARIRVATAPLGPCEMELIEVTGGRPPHAEFLDAHGEGMNHFNLDKCTHERYLETLSRLYHRGIEPFWGYPFGSFCYVEGPHLGGVTFEVMVGSGHAGKIGHNHLGLVIADTGRTIEFYSKTLGLGPFRTGEYPMTRAFYRDARIEAKFKASFCDLGESRLRVYEVLEGETPYSVHLDRQGEGMHDLCLPVVDLDDAIEDLRQVGIEVLWRSDELRLAHLATREIGGMTFAISDAPIP